MRTKNRLDKKISNTFTEESKIRNPKEKKELELRAKVEKFNKEAPKCENFYLKEGDLKSKIYWCREIDKACNYAQCPKGKNK